MMTKMAVTCLITSLVLATALLGCGENFGSFTFTETSQEVVVEGGDPLGILPDGALDVLRLNIDLEQELEARDADGARAVYLDGLALRITDTNEPDGDTDNFDFLESITIDVAADGLDTRQIATLDPVPDGQDRIELTVDDSIDLKPYVERGITLQTNAPGSRPDDDTSLEAIATIRVDVI